ncbi:MAG: exodeoxyribonuclease VII large subunit [Candidatus Marinimicrobia bacterium]|jgi:exodeoxyribonuclease VII large subunit|nr:exodeoxyribonuclease VII large subunit [Candidatus Neomarinimicrobiota bacterium]
MHMDQKPLSISELTKRIKSLIEGEFPEIWITGEISNFHHHSSGHMYFTLKDHQAEIKCTFFRGYNQYVRFKPEEGMQVIASGAVSVYEKRGQYQLSVRQLEPAGIGTLYLAFETLKKELQAEGLFAQVHKKSLPIFPKKVGIVTSDTGAALKDMIQVLGRRAPHISIVVRPTKVQGVGAAEDIVQGIKAFQSQQDIDVLIIGRGGGSLEDLWAFNEEIVAHAIYKSTIPIISAVGHEVDITISDLVADLRAPTPSAAAELASMTTHEIIALSEDHLNAIKHRVAQKILYRWQECDSLENRLKMRDPSRRIKRNKDILNRIYHQIEFAILTKQSSLKAGIGNIEKHLISLNPTSVLHRGFSIAKRKDGQIVRSNKDLANGDLFNIQTGDGQYEAEKKQNIDD